jgi:hypothetical protein
MKGCLMMKFPSNISRYLQKSQGSIVIHALIRSGSRREVSKAVIPPKECPAIINLNMFNCTPGGNLNFTLRISSREFFSESSSINALISYTR